MKRQYIM